MITPIRSQSGLTVGAILPSPMVTYLCESTDVSNLPTTGIAYGSTAFCTDTGDKYVFDDTGWVQLPANLIISSEAVFGM